MIVDDLFDKRGLIKTQDLTEGTDQEDLFYQFAQLFSHPDESRHPDPEQAVELVAGQFRRPEQVARAIIDFAKANPQELQDSAVQLAVRQLIKNRQGVAEGSLTEFAGDPDDYNGDDDQYQRWVEYWAKRLRDHSIKASNGLLIDIRIAFSPETETWQVTGKNKNFDQTYEYRYVWDDVRNKPQLHDSNQTDIAFPHDTFEPVDIDESTQGVAEGRYIASTGQSYNDLESFMSGDDRHEKQPRTYDQLQPDRKLDPKDTTTWRGPKKHIQHRQKTGGIRGPRGPLPEGWKSKLAGAALTAGIDAYARSQEKKKQAQAQQTFRPPGVAESSNSNVYFEVDSENAYNHVMEKVGSVINWEGDAMVAPRKYWGAIQELAYAAGGEANEVGDEQGVAEGPVEVMKLFKFAKGGGILGGQLGSLLGEESDKPRAQDPRLPKPVEENVAAGINKFYNNAFDAVTANLQRVALLAMQGRQNEAMGQLRSMIQSADEDTQGKIIAAVNNIKPVMIQGRVATSSELDNSKPHRDYILQTFLPWVKGMLDRSQSLQESSVRDKLHKLHQEIRSNNKRPNPKYYKELGASYDIEDDQKRLAAQKEIKKRHGVKEQRMTCPECGGAAYEDQILAEKQDACYHKVKSRYKVWPSAYASGALVRCRKKGAANWGNKGK